MSIQRSFLLICLLLTASFNSVPSFAALTQPRELFRIADTDPSWEELVVAVDTESSTGDIQNIRIYSGRDELYARDITRFAPGDQLSKSFITIVNESFYSSRGGRLQVYLGEQSVPIDILRQGEYWIANKDGKRLHKITAEVRRVLGIPVGINNDVPIITEKARQLIQQRSLMFLKQSFRSG